MTQPLLKDVCLPTKAKVHLLSWLQIKEGYLFLPLDSTMLLSPIFFDSTLQSTSKTLLLPITIVSSPLNKKIKC